MATVEVESSKEGNESQSESQRAPRCEKSFQIEKHSQLLSIMSYRSFKRLSSFILLLPNNTINPVFLVFVSWSHL